MNTSNLALRLEEFEAGNAPRTEARQAPRMSIVADPVSGRRTPRRLSLTTRRIQLRDPGMHRFRVF